MSDSPFPQLPADWEPTRATLHAYAHAVAVIPRTHAVPDDRWFHISLKLRPDGLVTDAMELPGGGTFRIRLDFGRHEAVVETDSAEVGSIPLGARLTGTEFGDTLITLVASLGLEGEYLGEKFANEEPREYDPAAAEVFFAALSAIAEVVEEHRAALDGDVGPLQVWPHGFDLAFEWYGTRTEVHDGVAYAAHLNLGWYPAGEAYFYSNPWPFEADALLGAPLPHGAIWHTEGWQGTMLMYDDLVGDADAGEKLRDYARAVFALTAPTLAA